MRRLIGLGCLLLLATACSSTSATTTTAEREGTTTTEPAAATTTLPEAAADVAAAEAMIYEFHETDFDKVIGTVVYPNCNYLADRDRVRCDIAYENAFYSVKADPDVTTKVFAVIGDAVTVIDQDLPADTEFNNLVIEYIEGFEGAQEACEDDASRSCGEFFMSHVDEWPQWYRDNRNA